MSILSDLILKLNVIKSNRDAIRTKLNAMGIGLNTDNLSTCATNINNIPNNVSKTTTVGAVSGTFSSGTTGTIYAKSGVGYNGPNTLLHVPVTNFASTNIKSGVAIGGLTGSYIGEYTDTELDDAVTLSSSI